MQAFQPLFHFNLPIPVWQIVLYVGLMSFFLIAHKVRLSLITSYLFILFWLYYSFRGDLVSVTKHDFVVKNVYDLFGFVLLGLGVFAFFFLERGNDVLQENLKKRSGEIADLKSKLNKAEKRTRSLELEVEETQSGLHAQASGIKRILDAKIDELEDRLEAREALLEKRDGEIAAYKLKAEEAEKRAHALETQVEENQRSFHTEESALKKKLEQELNAKIGALEGRLKDGESLLEKRRGEIDDLKLMVEEAEKKSRGWNTQAEETQQNFRTQEATLKKKLGEIEDLKLKGGEAEKKAQALKTHAEETQNRARALETQIEEIQRSFQTRESALKKKLDAKIDELEHRLKEREGLLEKRAGEIANFKLKAEEADKRAQDLKSQVAETQRSFHSQESALKKKLAEELNAKIGELENRLRDRESHLEKRDSEVANFKLKAEEAEKKAAMLKTKAEETKKTADALKTEVEASQHSFQAQGSALKKKLAAELNAKIAELEDRLKDREGLLAKRTAEVGDFKLKAEEAEKKAHALKAQVEETQKRAGALKVPEQKDRQGAKDQDSKEKKSLEQELKDKIFELRDLQAQVNHKDGLLSLMAKRNKELADLKSNADQRIEALEAQFKDGQQALRTEDSGNGHSNLHQNQKPRHT